MAADVSLFQRPGRVEDLPQVPDSKLVQLAEEAAFAQIGPQNGGFASFLEECCRSAVDPIADLSCNI